MIRAVLRGRPRAQLVGASAVVFGAGVAAMASAQSSSTTEHEHVLPSGLPRTCSIFAPGLVHEGTHQQPSTRAQPFFPVGSAQAVSLCDALPLSDAQRAVPDRLRALLQPEHVHTSESSTRQFTKGARLGKGTALAVVCPGSLKEAVEALRICASSGVVVITQGRNTGLSGGSVPRDTLCDRPTVIINTLRLNRISFVGDLALCQPGAGIYDLSVAAAQRGRQSHSVLGSIFLNPTVAAGVAFGSGGTQMRKGPSYTERAVWCRVAEDGSVEVVNTLGLKAANEDELLSMLESDQLTEAHFDAAAAAVPSSDAERYKGAICNWDSSVSRCNADTRGVDACRSEGKVMIIASLHDTFAPPSQTDTFWVACDTLETAQRLKKEVMLQNAVDLPISCEYMDRDSYQVVDQAGRIACHALNILGIGSALSSAWSAKLWVEGLPLPYANVLPDKLLYLFNNLAPATLPAPIALMAQHKDHHLLVALGEFGEGQLQRLNDRLAAFTSAQPEGAVSIYRCSPEDNKHITSFRFAAASSFRTWCVGKGLQGVSIDYALPKNFINCPTITDLGTATPVTRMRYSHFGCNVVHEDLAFAPGVDTHAAKMAIKGRLEGLGGALPAEHGHGTEYKAPAATQERWRKIDPSNTMNPGVGGMEYSLHYKTPP